MRNLSKSIVLLLLISFSQLGFSGEAILFDQANLIAFSDNGMINGFYDSENEKFSCYFLFSQRPEKDREVLDSNKYSATKMFTFLPGDSSLVFKDRHTEFDIEGLLFRKGDDWIIRTSRPQAGCANAMGVFEFDPSDIRAEIYVESKKITAIGIRLVNTKAFFYDLRGRKFVARKGYLTKSNGVILLKTYGQFSYVRFSDPRVNVENPNRMTSGWVRSAHLVNPFPPAAKQ